MNFKVYNENGVIRVTKVISEGVEIPMFSGIQPGQTAEIVVEANVSYSACLKEIKNEGE